MCDVSCTHVHVCIHVVRVCVCVYTCMLCQVTASPSAAHYFGLVDAEAEHKLHDLADQTVQAIQVGDYTSALAIRTALEDSIVSQSGINLMDVRATGNYLAVQQPIRKFLDQEDTKAALHVGNHTFKFSNQKVLDALNDDKMKSMASLFPNLLSHLKVMLYQGQFDLKDGVISTEIWVKNVQWSGIPSYQNASRCEWRSPSDGSILGYAKKFSNLTNVVIRNAGHMAPMDQPVAAYDLIGRFIRDVSFNSTCF
eukprot:c1814_g1_i1.p1 GENE.c1814_g1_i1~~c1814_g1_i1.p1  ORF type:complete len:253 (+),score=54.93 c1814_g1_i1:847-1605(+)